MEEQSYNVEERPLIDLQVDLETASLPEFLFFDYNNKLDQKTIKIKCAASLRRGRLGEFGVALLHGMDFSYKTLHRCRAANTKRFFLASRSRSSFQKFSN